MSEPDFRNRYLYNHKGRCRKCNHRLIREGQSGAIPPRESCGACRWTDWDKVYFRRPDKER